MISAAEHQLLVRAAAVVDGRQVVAHHARVRKLRVIALRDALASARQRLQPTIHRFTSPQHTVTAYISMRPLDGDSVAEWLGRWICHHRSRFRILAFPLSNATLGKLLITQMCQSPSSIIWYQPMGGDALRLGRLPYVWCHTGHGSQTLVVLHLRAQGLGEGDEHPPTFS